AITAYEAEYSRFPTSETGGDKDAAFGDVTDVAATGTKIITSAPAPGLNSDVMIILRDVDFGPNAGSVKNPRHHNFLNAKDVEGTGKGISKIDRIYRDPWGNPYIITLDLDYDQQCADPFYGKVRQPALVWSFGPDGKYDSADVSAL